MIAERAAFIRGGAAIKWGWVREIFQPPQNYFRQFTTQIHTYPKHLVSCLPLSVLKQNLFSLSRDFEANDKPHVHIVRTGGVRSSAPFRLPVSTLGGEHHGQLRHLLQNVRQLWRKGCIGTVASPPLIPHT